MIRLFSSHTIFAANADIYDTPAFVAQRRDMYQSPPRIRKAVGALLILSALGMSGAFFTRAPVPPCGTVRGSAPRNPACRETTAVKPWSFAQWLMPFPWFAAPLHSSPPDASSAYALPLAEPPALLPAEPAMNEHENTLELLNKTPQGTAAGVAALSAEPKPAPRLIIEKIGVNIPIVEGKDENALWRGAWRSPWSSTPDQNGNTVIFGHRYRYLPPDPETFFSLDKVAVGDTFQIQWNGATRTYRVAETKIVPPEDISVLRQTSTPTVTLITCTPVFTTKERLIVRGELL